jgi:glycerophosphoryl diester phosphodiesterase
MKPIIVAHRGLHTHHPENSLAAFHAAWAAGINWCECDVHLSSDNKVVVIHDDTVDRTTAGHGLVAKQTAAELSNLGIPTLDDLLNALPHDCHLWVETKPIFGRRIIPLAKKLQKYRCALHSFHAKDVQAAAKFAEVALLSEGIKRLPHSLKRLHLDHKLLNAKTVAALRSRGHILGAWTVNSKKEIQRMTRLGIDLVITDRPL